MRREPRVRLAPQLLGVLVPVRDEQELLPRCLAALADAARALHGRHPEVAIRVVIVLDGCTDDSSGVVDQAPWPAGLVRPLTVSTHALGVGAARATGAARLIGLAGDLGVDTQQTWLASTDADSTVNVGWLIEQVEAAVAGREARVGTVVLDTGEPDAGVANGAAPHTGRVELAARWARLQQHVEGHPHVHGANLGVRADWYLRVGGFPAVPSGEDARLVDALAAAGAAVLRTAQHPVVTSDRRAGRAPGGVADDLADLAGSLPATAQGNGPTCR